MTNPDKRLLGIIIFVAILLIIPFIAMQITSEVNWTLYDFALAGGLLLGTGLLCEVVIRNVKKVAYRFIICIGVVMLFLLVWLELAVGIFGSPFAGQ